MEYVTLNNGVKMPVLGFGTFRLNDLDECERCVLDAIKVGYRMIDTAQMYQNEVAVGNAIKKCGVPREELFIVTKLWPTDFEGDAPLKAFKKSLERLQTDYIDLVFIHWPYGNYYNAYRTLEKLYKEGKIRAIGVSNFEPARFLDICRFNEIAPQVNQVELHLFCQKQEERKFYDKVGCVTEGYATLGQGKRDDMFELPSVKALAKKYGKTERQICLRYFTQIGTPIIPKSAHHERIVQNFDLFDFKFTDEELEILRNEDQNKPHSGRAELGERFEKIIGLNK